MKNLLAIIISLLYIGCTVSKKTMAPKVITQKGDTILMGKTTVALLKEPPFSKWFDTTYRNYSLADTTGVLIDSRLKGISVKIYMGTWCGDSRREVPRFYKILNTWNAIKKVELIGLGNIDTMYKRSPQGDEKELSIYRVPTFIVYEAGKEIGRIIEKPVQSLEQDLLTIINKQPYTPQYHNLLRFSALIEQKLQENAVVGADSLLPLVKATKVSAGEVYSYATVKLYAGDYLPSRLAFEINILMNPDAFWAYNGLGKYYTCVGEYLKAKKMYEKSLALNPANEAATSAMREINKK
jgi:thiol-disulfide isomerase/thioredoxin